jgi:tetratricopeptide (TPR) repeat protein
MRHVVYQLVSAVACLAVGGTMLMGQEAFWRPYNVGGWRACHTGDLAKARELLDKAWKEAESFPKTDPRRALTLAYRAYLTAKEGKESEAAQLAEQSLAIYDKAVPDSTPEMGKGLNALGLAYRALKKYLPAEALFKRAVEHEEKHAGKDSLIVAQIMLNQAALYEERGRYQDAVAVLQRALKIVETYKEKEEPRLAAVEHQLGSLHRTWGKDAAAETHFTRALEIRLRLPGEVAKEQLDLAATLAELGSLYFDRKQLGKAEQDLTEALKIREKVAGKAAKDRLDVAVNLHNLATVHLARNSKRDPKQFALAEEEFNRALDIKEKVLGQGHAELAVTVEALADLYARANNSAEAEKHFQRALEIREKTRGAEHVSVAGTLQNLANFYRDNKRYKEAEPLYQRALAIREKTLGTEHASLAPLLDNYAALLRKTDRAAEAKKLDERAKAIRAKTPATAPKN